MDISVVIPLLNEEESIEELNDWIASVMQSNRFSYEVIFIDDGSKDHSWQVISKLAKEAKHIRGIKFRRNFGKSQALHAGFLAAEGDIIVTMDADLQDNPEEIPDLVKMIRQDNFDLVSGWKKKRYDAVLTKNLPSKLFNAAARSVSKLQLHDFNCGLKAYKKEVVKAINVYGEMHRYIPVLAKNAGFDHIGEKIVKHQARKYGKTKFGMSRFINGFLDLMTISFLSKFGRRPMHFFGAIGVFMFSIGFLFALYLGVDKLLLNPSGRLITDRPQFYLALTTMVLGTQFFVGGFLGELILRTKRQKTLYEIDEQLNL